MPRPDPPPWCGKVLFAGGGLTGGVRNAATAEIFDPATGRFTPTAAMRFGRHGHTATVLQDGRVLVVGGYIDENVFNDGLADAEVYDPTTGTWALTGSTAGLVGDHTATLLADGMVLVAGGARFGGANNTVQPMATAQLYDPLAGPPAGSAPGAVGAWVPTGMLHEARWGHTATLLSDHRVLVAGGVHGDQATGMHEPTSSVEIYDPSTHLWSLAKGHLAIPRFLHSATLLDGPACATAPRPATCGQVLVVDGTVGTDSLHFLTPLSAEIYDPVADSWRSASPPLEGRVGHSASPLADGTVLLAGSSSGIADSRGTSSATAEIYDPAANSWRYTDSMRTNRGAHGVAVLGGPACRSSAPFPAYCASVLVVGGSDLPTPLEHAIGTAEWYTPAATVTAISTTRGQAKGGSAVAITGSGFVGDVAVTFGDTPAAAVHVESPTRLTATAPAHAPGPVEVSVAGAGGTSAADVANPAARFVYAGPAGQVTDLEATAVLPSQVELSFTAPDDGTTLGLATTYVIKQSSSPIATDADFESAPALCGGLCTVESGLRVTVSVGNLAPATTYHYAVQAVGPDGQAGPISASASATTLGHAADAACAALEDLGANQLVLRARRYQLVAAPGGSVIGSTSPLYGWMDQGAGGAYSVDAPTTAVTAGRGYWAWSACDHLVDLVGPPGPPSATLSVPLGAYHASMVGNPSATSPATVSGQDFAAAWDPDANGGAGAYRVSGYRQPQTLAVGEGSWVFSYSSTKIAIQPRS